jgi:hypothetical protein
MEREHRGGILSISYDESITLKEKHSAGCHCDRNMYVGC